MNTPTMYQTKRLKFITRRARRWAVKHGFLSDMREAGKADYIHSTEQSLRSIANDMLKAGMVEWMDFAVLSY